MSPSTSEPRQPHLLEVGLTWPPETFICAKLAGLAQRGFRVTVASAYVYDEAFSIPGVQLERIPNGEESPARALLGAVGDALGLALAHPRRFAALLRALARPEVRSPARASLTFRKAPWWKARDELAWFRLLAPLARWQADVVHFEWESTAVAYLPLVYVWRCPMVMSCHGGLAVYAQRPASARMMAGLPAAFGHAAAVQCVSRAERDAAVEHGLEPGKAHIISCGVDPTAFSPEPRAKDPEVMRVLAVGWLRWLKGYEYAVLTIRLLRDAGVPAELDIFGGDPLALLGEASDRARIAHTIRDLGLDRHVRLRGHVPSAELVRHLREADALLHSSVSEGVPVAILEAMACGVPVVASDCGGVSDAVRDGQEGFLFPARDPRGAAAALEHLWRDPGLRKRFGQAGRRRAQYEFAWDRQLDRLVALYRRLGNRSEPAHDRSAPLA